MALLGIAAMAQEKVRVHNGDETYVTTIEQITFDVTDADQAISVTDLATANDSLSTANATLTGEKATLANEKTALTAKNDSLSTANATLTGEKDALKADTASLKAEKKTLNDKVKQLQFAFAPEDYYVDLGLSVMWATCNVGANAPEEYGDYFAWGEIEGYNTSKKSFNWSTYKWCNGSETTMTKYCTSNSYGTVDNKKQLDLADDAARANWGGKWRMPTVAEWEELYNNTTHVWTDDYNGTGVKGYVLTSTKEGYEGASIFLPAAGFCNEFGLDYGGSGGYYWLSSLYEYNSNNTSRRLYFNQGYFGQSSSINRCYGQSVRPVCPPAEDVLKAEKQALEGQINGLNSQVDGLKADTTTLNGQIKTLTGEKDALKADTASLKAEKKTLNDKVKQMQFAFAPEDYYVDLGLSVMWATCNVGASAPQEYGDYFAWGETEGYNTSKKSFNWSTYKWCNVSSSTMTKYCTSNSDGTVDNKTQLDLADDAARANWGGKWRMPTQAEWEELYNNTTQVWTNNYNGTGVKGYVLTSTKEGYEGASIFLPAADYRIGDGLDYGGSYGSYWSSSLYENSSDGGRYLFFYSGDFNPWNINSRCYGQSVRPVCPSAE